MNQTSVISPLLLPHHLVHSPPLPVCTPDTNTHTQFAFSLLLSPFCLKHVHASVSSVYFILPFIIIAFPEEKISICFLKGEWLIFPGFAFLPIYFSRVTLWLLSPPPLFSFVFSSLISSFYRFFFTHSLLPFVFSFLASLFTHMCAKNPALGLHCLFHVRTSGDIKGPLRGLSVCISSALTVCAQDPSMRLTLHSITPRPKPLVGREQHACTRWL